MYDTLKLKQELHDHSQLMSARKEALDAHAQGLPLTTFQRTQVERSERNAMDEWMRHGGSHGYTGTQGMSGESQGKAWQDYYAQLSTRKEDIQGQMQIRQDCLLPGEAVGGEHHAFMAQSKKQLASIDQQMQSGAIELQAGRKPDLPQWFVGHEQQPAQLPPQRVEVQVPQHKSQEQQVEQASKSPSLGDLLNARRERLAEAAKAQVKPVVTHEVQRTTQQAQQALGRGHAVEVSRPLEERRGREQQIGF